jgi:YD repeat-containing protein
MLKPPPSSCSDPTACFAEDICFISWAPGGFDAQADLYAPEEHEGVRIYASTDIALFPEATFFSNPQNPSYPASYWSGVYWSLRTPDGGSHMMILVSGDDVVTGEYRSADGTGWDYEASSCTLRDNEGTVYQFACRSPLPGGYGFGFGGVLALYTPGALNYEEDTNGNRITVNYSPQGAVANWSDTMGRTIPAPPVFPTSFFGPPTGVLLTPAASGCPASSLTSYSWQIPGVATPFIFCETWTPVQTHLFPPAYYGDPYAYTHYTDFKGNIPMIAGVIQPSGDMWAFGYTPQVGDPLFGTAYNLGDLTQITLPTGGQIQYRWETPENFCGVYPQGTTAHGLVRSRSLSVGNGQPLMTWTYSGSLPDEFGSNGIVETDPAGNVTLHGLSLPTASGQVIGGCSSYEGLTQYYDNQQNLLKTETTTYEALPLLWFAGTKFYSSGALPISKSTTWPDQTTTTTTFAYDNGFNNSQSISQTPLPVSYGNQILKNEYGFSSGAGTLGTLLRSTTTSYVAFGGFALSQAALQQNMLSLPSSIVETDAFGGGSHSTNYFYDTSSSLVSGNATPGFGTGTGGWDQALTNGPMRGNQTLIEHYLNTSNQWLATQVGYTDTGMIASITLPSNAPHPDTTTTYGYSGTYQGALLTSATNSLSQSKTYVYDPILALPSISVDENGNPTTYAYWPDTRLKSITSPATQLGNPVTEYFYPSPTLVKKKTKQDNSTWITRETFYDGLGRAASTQLLGGCTGGDYIGTETTYDLLGRVSTVTNPHCGGSSSSTDGITTHQYDALNRPTIVSEPDGSYQQWTYFDDSTTFWDENHVAPWVRTEDALGRLAQVIEPGSLQTNYTYDAFNNLLSVNQLGGPGDTARQRSFTYDSLSRLITSTNPEAGTICYGMWSGGANPDFQGPPIPPIPPGPPSGPPTPTPSGCQGGYDAHSNLLVKTDSRGIKTNYAYDPLNRLLGKSYIMPFSGRAPGSVTPPSTFVYDAAPNAIGRLVSEFTGPAPNKNIFNCASEAASKVSIAGGLQALGIGTSGVGGFITNALGGNTFSGITDLASSIGSGSAGGHSVFYNMGQSVVAGPLQGLPGGSGAWGSSASGLATNAIAQGVHAAISTGGELTTLAGTASTVGLTGAEYATGVGELKLAYDALTYVGAGVGCGLGLIP